MAVEQSPPDRLRCPLLIKALLICQRRSRLMLETVRRNHNDVTIKRADHLHVVPNVVWLDDIYVLDHVFVVVPTERKGSLAALGSAAGVRLFGFADSSCPTNRVGESLVHEIAEIAPGRNIPSIC